MCCVCIYIYSTVQAGQSKLIPVPGKDQTLVTGSGGPSGTGRKPANIDQTVLPPPVFLQDVINYNRSPSITSTTVKTTAGGAVNGLNRNLSWSTLTPSTSTLLPAASTTMDHSTTSTAAQSVDRKIADVSTLPTAALKPRCVVMCM